VKRWWLVIALVLSIGMNLGLLIALALSSPALVQQQQGVMRPAAPGRLQQLAELNLVQARAQRYVVTVNLFVAAGGGMADTSKRMAMAR